MESALEPVADLGEVKARAYRIADNQTATIAEWDSRQTELAEPRPLHVGYAWLGAGALTSGARRPLRAGGRGLGGGSGGGRRAGKSGAKSDTPHAGELARTGSQLPGRGVAQVVPAKTETAPCETVPYP